MTHSFHSIDRISVFLLSFSCKISKMIFNPKYTISTALIIENPVNSPNVPPMAAIMSTNLDALSLVIRSNVDASK